jgi:hypothetical protein
MKKEYVTCDSCGKIEDATKLSKEWITFNGRLTILHFEEFGVKDFCSTSCFVKFVIDKKTEYENMVRQE